MTISLTVNGAVRTLDVQIHHTLLETLRDQLNLTGTKECCAEGECGACTVLLNGRAINACLVLAVECDGEDVFTIEGLCRNGQMDPVQQAFVETGAVQCGFCIPGIIMSAADAIARRPACARDEVRRLVAGNLCRCTGYTKIIDAVELARDRVARGEVKPLA